MRCRPTRRYRFPIPKLPTSMSISPTSPSRPMQKRSRRCNRVAPVWRAPMIGVVLLIGLAAPAAAADSLTSLDEYDVRSAIILNCHPGQNAADRAFLAKGDALRRAALQQLWAQLDAADR